MSKTEKAPQEKLEGDIAVALQTALGKPLTPNQVEQVYLLAYDVARINDPANEQPVPPLNQGLQSLLDETGLKASQIAPITALVANYHPAGSVRDDVNSAIGTFKEVHKVELAEATKAKSTDFLASIVKDLEKTSGTRLNDSESTKVAELTSSLKNIGDPDGPAKFNKALKEFEEMAPSQVGNFTARIEEFHKNEPEKQALVTPVLEPFKESVKVKELNQQITEEVQKLANGPLSKEQLESVDKLSQSVGYIKDKDNLPTLTLCLDEVVKNLTPEQAKPILDLVKNYHKDDVDKQELVSSGLENVTLKKEPEIEVAVDSLGSASVDDITQAIRDEVITKQQAYLQGEIAKLMPVEEGVAFNNKTPEEMRAYLGTEEGKLAVKEVMKIKEAQLAMNKIEVDGYKKVHETFKDSFKNVGWDQEPGAKVRIAEIKNEAGEKIASLKETTVDSAPTQVTLEDGTTRTIKSYRQIDFPLNLEDGKGPAHLSMAVKDENGRNISAKDAVYFTAHYDDNGKLTEVSSPVPVKFMGDGDDAIGYIERNGKVYTLPVTQGKYEKMMQEVAINNGLGVDVGQSVDSVSVPPRTVVGQDLQELDVPKRSGPVAIDPEKLQKVDPVTLELDVPKRSGPIAIDPEKLQKADPKLTTAEELGDKPKESRLVAINIEIPAVKLEEPKLAKLESSHVEVVTINPITGKEITQEVVKKAQEFRKVLDTSLPRAPEVNNEKEALKLLSTSKEDSLKAISTAISKGDEKLVKAMMDVIDKPPEGVQIPGKVALTKVYKDQIDKTKNMEPKEKAQVQRAAGAIANKAGVDHKQQLSVLGPKQTTSQTR